MPSGDTQLIAKMQNLERDKIGGKVKIVTKKAGTNEILRTTEWYKNLVVSGANTGRNIIIQRLARNNNYSLNITHGEIGTGQITPQNSDTGLNTPIARGIVTEAIPDVSSVKFQFFMSDSQLPNGTYYEFGTFIDGNSALGSGQLFNHALFGTPYQKNSGEDTTVEVNFEISAI